MAPVTEAEIAAWYQANQARVQGASLEQVRQPIRSFLTQERMQAGPRAVHRRPEEQDDRCACMLDPPRQKVRWRRASPTRGPADAPIEIIEFSDFECPFCQRVGPALKQVFDTYGDRVQLVYREYPLPNHPNARPASEASDCAPTSRESSGRITIGCSPISGGSAVATSSNTPSISVSTPRSFNACLDSHKYKRASRRGHQRRRTRPGVNGTPAFFINGRLISGAQPFEAFRKIIDDELALEETMR